MKSLYIPKTSNTPQVNLSVEDCQFEIIGTSYSDNIFDAVYSKILDWIDTELPMIECDLNCIFSIDLLNSISYKNILQILIKFTDLKRNGKNMTITWYFDGNDEDNEELGINLSEIFDIPFIIKAIDE